ncbi:MAG: ferritin family protein [Planctomycetota bacterium]
MATLISLDELIDAAVTAEGVARKVYLGFTHRFMQCPDAANFWQTMADDESDHARILKDIRQHVSAEELASPVDARLADKAHDLRSLNPQALVNSITNLDDAYQIAYDLESSEVNTVFNFLTIRFLSTDESYDIITATIDRHLLRLAEFTRTFGDAEQCRQITVSA